MPAPDSSPTPKLTLGQAFLLSLTGLFAVLAVLFYFLFGQTKQTLLDSAETLRARSAEDIEHRVSAILGKAPACIASFQQATTLGLVDLQQPRSIAAALFAPLLGTSEITEISLTYGEQIGFDPDGNIQLTPASIGQWSVGRTGEEDTAAFWIQHTYREAGDFVADRQTLSSHPLTPPPSLHRIGYPVPDPTAHATFSTPASQPHFGQLLTTDLHWSQLDAHLPEPERRIEVSALQAITTAEGKFLGVLRVGLLTRQLDDAIARLTDSAHRIFLCDTEGRLITRLSPSDRMEEFDDALRIKSTPPIAEITQALSTPDLRQLGDKMPTIPGQFRLGSEDFLTTFHALPGTQDWLVGIVVPRSAYLGRLADTRTRLLLISLVTITALLAGGAAVLRIVKQAQAQITCESRRMTNFDFSPAPTDAPFRDVSEVLASLEQAKTAMRAMGKYVPIDLVRRLYCERTEPTLGGQDTEVSLMFTDIKDFTAYSEQLPPNQLADALGRYLDVMARIIQQECRGTIDKYIGDAIMTIWNAPEPVVDHARMACTAALRCRDAARALCQSPAWQGLPVFETRFGLHRGEALVGHFGAHDRMNYTAIGDTVNLASRLEGLNKQYGTTIIASEAIVELVRDHFTFRPLDRVAVKGKTQAVQIYELLSEKSH